MSQKVHDDVRAADEPVSAAVIGAGMFGTAIVTQSSAAPGVDVRVVADAELDRAREAFRLAGFDDEAVAPCESRASAMEALEAGRRVVLSDALIAADLPVEVIVEATGAPEAGALHALEAIRHGRHVVMVNKEADAVVGPVLKRLADREGVAYTPADGDQHGLLIALVEWARGIGLEVVCGGKARVGELVMEEADGGLSVAGHGIEPADAPFFAAIEPGRAGEFGRRRREALGGLRQVDHGDMEEMAIAANATGLLPQTERMHHAVLRTREIPEALCPRDDGGILERAGAVDVVNCLRRPDEAGLGGGVFVVVACESACSRGFLVGKGHVWNSAGTAALLCRPYHLCGVETPASILRAAAQGPAASPADYRPRIDVVVRAGRGLRAGERVDEGGLEALRTEMHPAAPVEPGRAVPLRMALGARLARGVPEGALLTVEAIEPPADSVLWRLRREQDAMIL